MNILLVYPDFPDVDHFLLNQAKIALPPFLADLSNWQAQHIYQMTDFPDIRQTPAPRWDLVDFKQYARIDIQFSRGCPYDYHFRQISELSAQAL